MLRRAFVLLAGGIGLAACSSETYYSAPPSYGTPTPLGLGGPQPGPASEQTVAILLPLSGPRADIGQAMLQAAKLALDAPNAPRLVQEDTAGTPQGAAAAARAAINAGAHLILGPLSVAETMAAAPVATASGVPVLAFTNDPTAARPGVWTLGITPGQQVGRLVDAVSAAGKTRLAALLPDSDFGHAMATALTQAATARGLAPPDIHFHAPGMRAINQAGRDISNYTSRWGPIEQQIRAARAEGTAAGRRKAAALAKTPLPPPAFDALLLADTGEALSELAAVLPYYFIGPPAVQILGPALWADPRSGSGQLPGAWYAAPDQSARSAFVQAFTTKYGTAPRGVADLAFDAAAIARVVAPTGFATDALTTARGFAGSDGWLALLPDGKVRRGLAVFSVQRGGPQLVAPAPAPGTTGA